MLTMIAAALGDVGLVQVPAPIAAERLASGRLEEVLPDHAPSSPGAFLYFASRTQVMPNPRAFIDHVTARVSSTTNGPCASGSPLQPSAVADAAFEQSY